MQRTFDISLLPEIEHLRKLTQALAMLDAIIEPEWEYRFYSFNSTWADGEQLASMRNGSGDHWFLLFCDAGAALHALEHEAKIFTYNKPYPGIFNNLPSEFHANFLHEAAFETNNSTFSCWRRFSDAEWHRGNAKLPDLYDADGSVERLVVLLGKPEQYVKFVSEYYEKEVALTDISAIYRHTPLTNDLIVRLNPETTFESLQKSIREIGYPASNG
jgi:hypothetical protein